MCSLPSEMRGTPAKGHTIALMPTAEFFDRSHERFRALKRVVPKTGFQRECPRHASGVAREPPACLTFAGLPARRIRGLGTSKASCRW